MQLNLIVCRMLSHQLQLRLTRTNCFTIFHVIVCQEASLEHDGNIALSTHFIASLNNNQYTGR